MKHLGIVALMAATPVSALKDLLNLSVASGGVSAETARKLYDDFTACEAIR